MSGKWAEVTARILELTEAKKIVWETSGEAVRFRNFTRHGAIGTAFFCEFTGKFIALYEREIRDWSDEYAGVVSERNVVIEFVDANGELQWAWPVLAGVGQEFATKLLDAVRRLRTGADDFADLVLAAKKAHAERE